MGHRNPPTVIPKSSIVSSIINQIIFFSLQDNRITAWKFCHVLHKLLREGHALVIQHSMRHRAMITEMGKLWGHLNDGYGLCIKHYTKLLVMKLEFHDRNPRFPGNLVLRRGELDKIAGNDINVYFQLAVEMFDYLDEIVALQATSKAIGLIQKDQY